MNAFKSPTSGETKYIYRLWFWCACKHHRTPWSQSGNAVLSYCCSFSRELQPYFCQTSFVSHLLSYPLQWWRYGSNPSDSKVSHSPWPILTHKSFTVFCQREWIPVWTLDMSKEIAKDVPHLRLCLEGKAFSLIWLDMTGRIILAKDSLKI